MEVAANRNYVFNSRRLLSAALLLSLSFQSSPVVAVADNPGEALQRQFESAKSALAAGNLARAEDDYRLTIALGLRQLGNLSISEQQFDQATTLLDAAVKLSPADAALQLEDGIAWFRKGDTQKSAEIIQSVLSVHPDDARAHNVLGRLHLFNGDVDASIVELQKAVALQDDFETAYFLGIAFLRAKKTVEAADLFGKLQAAAGDSAALHVLFGRAYTVTHFPEQAVAEFRKAINRDPKYPRAHALLGYATLEFYGESSYPQARKLFEQELQIQPNDYLSLMLLGISTTSLRDYPAAEAALLRATRLRPDGASPYLYLGETYTSTARYKEAVAALQKYVALVHSPQESNRNLSRGYFLLGQDLMRLGGHTEEARQALARSQQLREAQFKYDQEHLFLDPKQQKEQTEPETSADARSLSSDRMAGVLEAGSPEEDRTAQEMAQGGLPPDSAAPSLSPESAVESQAAKQYRVLASEILASSYNDLGVMRAKTAQFAEAAEYFKQAHTWNPALPGLDRNYGFAAYRAEQYSEAIPPLERQLSAHPDDAFVRQLLGLSYFDVENYAKTAEVLSPFLINPPDDPALLFAWGTALVRIRESTQAAKIFQRLLEQNVTNPGIHSLLGQAYAQQQDYPSALRELKSAVQLDSRLPEAHYYTGLVYLHLSDFENAAAEFRAELALRPSDPVTTYHLAFALLSLGQTEQAVALFRDAVQSKPDYELAYFELGRALLQQGDIEGAIASLEQAKKLLPGRDLTYFQLSQAYRRAGRSQEADQALTTYKKMIEESRQKKRQSLETETP
jgi:tetratricopeptide (TPR) repeat protein